MNVAPSFALNMHLFDIDPDLLDTASMPLVEGLRTRDNKRKRRFHYDPSSMMSALHYWRGTLIPIVLGSSFFWFCLLLYAGCIVLQRDAQIRAGESLGGELTFVKLSALGTPGALYSFFITGQLGRVYGRWSDVRENCRKAGLTIITLTLMLSGGRPNKEQLAIVRKIVKCFLSSLLITYINVCDYLNDLAPPSKYMVVHELLTPEEAATVTLRTESDAVRNGRARDAAAPKVYYCGQVKLQQAAEFIEDAKDLKLKCHFGPGFLAKYTLLAELLTKMENVEDDTVAPSLHLFSSMFTLVYLPLLSIGMAQHVADYTNLTDYEHCIISILGFMAVFLTNFAFLGMYHLVAAMMDPFGTDSSDIPCFLYFEECVGRTNQLLSRASAALHTKTSPPSGGSGRRNHALTSPRSVQRIEHDMFDNLVGVDASERESSRYRGIKGVTRSQVRVAETVEA
jgi:hypothetical protein